MRRAPLALAIAALPGIAIAQTQVAGTEMPRRIAGVERPFEVLS